MATDFLIVGNYMCPHCRAMLENIERVDGVWIASHYKCDYTPPCPNSGKAFAIPMIKLEDEPEWKADSPWK